VIRRLITIVTATGLLSGCSGAWLSKAEPNAQEQRARLIGIGWGGHDWRSCEEDKTCPKPTPKTVVLSAPWPSVIAPPQLPEPSVASAPKPDIAHRVNFQFSQAVPTKEGADQLTKILRGIRKTHVIHITGHTDDLGGNRFNDRLALRRAGFVAAWLKRRGIRIPMEIEARGKCCYLASNNTDDGRAANRRVEVVLRERQSDLTSNMTSTTKKEIVR